MGYTDRHGRPELTPAPWFGEQTARLRDAGPARPEAGQHAGTSTDAGSAASEVAANTVEQTELAIRQAREAMELRLQQVEAGVSQDNSPS